MALSLDVIDGIANKWIHKRMFTLYEQLLNRYIVIRASTTAAL